MNTRKHCVSPDRRAARLPDHLTEILIENAADCGRDIRPGRAQRSDGWTPDRIRNFLELLARGEGVARAAGTAGISPKSAYALRNGAKGVAFARAWDAAVLFGRRQAEGRLFSIPMGMYVVPIIRNGKVSGERYRHDNRRLMAALTRLDRLTSSARTVR